MPSHGCGVLFGCGNNNPTGLTQQGEAPLDWLFQACGTATKLEMQASSMEMHQRGHAVLPVSQKIVLENNDRCVGVIHETAVAQACDKFKILPPCSGKGQHFRPMFADYVVAVMVVDSAIILGQGDVAGALVKRCALPLTIIPEHQGGQIGNRDRGRRQRPQNLKMRQAVDKGTKRHLFKHTAT